MPFVDIDGDKVEKGALIKDERSTTLSGDVDTTDIDMTGLVSVDEVVNVDYNTEEVDETNNITAEIADPSSDISGNTVTVTFYTGDTAGAIVPTSNGDAQNTTSDGDTVTVTAEGY
jgi:hypothetical protein